MEYRTDATDLFNYIPRMPSDTAWDMIERVVDAENKRLHSLKTSHANIKTIDEYFNKKKKRILILLSPLNSFVPFFEYDEIIINGRKYKNLRKQKKLLNGKHLNEIFKNDIYSEIHGGLTVENIIYLPGEPK